jgi:hypothetical protein
MDYNRPYVGSGAGGLMSSAPEGKGPQARHGAASVVVSKKTIRFEK